MAARRLQAFDEEIENIFPVRTVASDVGLRMDDLFHQHPGDVFPANLAGIDTDTFRHISPIEPAGRRHVANLTRRDAIRRKFDKATELT